MSRYIEVDALIDRLDYCVKEGMGSTIAFTFKHMVEDAPSIDIVRCKECKYAEVYDGYYTQVCCENGVIGGHGELWNPDDFCSYGERKESE